MLGGYNFSNFELAYSMGTQRSRAINLSFERGTFYGGHRRSIGLNTARLEVTPQPAGELWLVAVLLGHGTIYTCPEHDGAPPAIHARCMEGLFDVTQP